MQMETGQKIMVIVRKRPLGKKELARGEGDIVDIRDNCTVVVKEIKQKVDLTKFVEEHNFNFDLVFDQTTTNEQLYSTAVRPIIEAAFNRAKVTCFAYGQTGSGKTHTMIGDAEAGNPGLYLLASYDIFSLLEQPQFLNLHLTISFYEIYCGKLFDLLNDKVQLQAREDAKGNVNIVGLSEKKVTNVQGLMQIIQLGQSVRVTSSNSSNSESSRSHALLIINLKQGKHLHGKLSFIDLAGSERGADVQDQNKQTRLDGAEINKSLLALKECIRAIDLNKNHTPFRGSKLTLVLKDSFTGNCRTVMIGNISPSSQSSEHTLNTLRYADRVKELRKPQEGGQLTQQEYMAKELMLARQANNIVKKVYKHPDDESDEEEVYPQNQVKYNQQGHQGLTKYNPPNQNPQQQMIAQMALALNPGNQRLNSQQQVNNQNKPPVIGNQQNAAQNINANIQKPQGSKKPQNGQQQNHSQSQYMDQQQNDYQMGQQVQQNYRGQGNQPISQMQQMNQMQQINQNQQQQMNQMDYNNIQGLNNINLNNLTNQGNQSNQNGMNYQPTQNKSRQSQQYNPNQQQQNTQQSNPQLYNNFVPQNQNQNQLQNQNQGQNQNLNSNQNLNQNQSQNLNQNSNQQFNNQSSRNGNQFFQQPSLFNNNNQSNQQFMQQPVQMNRVNPQIQNMQFNNQYQNGNQELVMQQQNSGLTEELGYDMKQNSFSHSSTSEQPDQIYNPQNQQQLENYIEYNGCGQNGELTPQQQELQKLSNQHEDLVQSILQEEEEVVNSHRIQIDKMVEITKEEMLLLNRVDQQGSDIQTYVNELHLMLDGKIGFINILKNKLNEFSAHLKEEEVLSKKFYEQRQAMMQVFDIQQQDDLQLLDNLEHFNDQY